MTFLTSTFQEKARGHQRSSEHTNLEYSTVLLTNRGRTYKGQFTFFKKIYCARIRDKFLQKIIFNQKIWSNFFFLGELKFAIAQKIAETASCVKCQLGEVPVWKCVSWGERVEKFDAWTDDISPIL